MVDEQAPFQHLPQRAARNHHCQKRSGDQRELHRSLPTLIPRKARAGTAGYNPLIPSAMASQSSWSFGRKIVIAMMAITTSTSVS